MMKNSATIFSSIALIMKLVADPISIEDRRDYEILEQFFRMGVSEEGYGYVLTSLKPIAIRDFYAIDSFPISKDLQFSEKEFLNTLLVRETLPIWQRVCSFHGNFVLKALPLEDHESIIPGWEVQFINVPKLRKVIEENIDIFRYALGPSVEIEQLLTRILTSNERLYDILQNDLVLVGIVLGFGSHNSLMGGRLETIESLSISKDNPPYTSKGTVLQQRKDWKCFSSYYLDYAGGDDTLFRKSCIPLNPSFGFETIEKEHSMLEAMSEPLPNSLKNHPKFIFGAFRGGRPNQQFFKELQAEQKRIQQLLNKSDFLEEVLKFIGGKKPIISCDQRHANSQSYISLDSLSCAEWSKVLKRAVSRYKDEVSKSAFIDAFHQPSSSSRTPPKMIGVTQTALEGLKKARHNLTEANAYFENLSSDASMQIVVLKQLYFKTILQGSGKELKEFDYVRVGYVIEDGKGNILFANHDIWLNLSQTIPGLVHGVQGMKVGEKRQIFIHPALAYGALTTLPPCSELIVTIKLIDIDDKISSSLPTLPSLKLDWIQDPIFYTTIEESVKQYPRFVASFYRDLLDRTKRINLSTIIAELEHSPEDSYKLH